MSYSQDNKGHRARLRERFLKDEGAAMADYELLELTLFQAQPRGDTKPLSKALLKRFGSIGAVLSASPAVDNPFFKIVEVDENDRLLLSKPLPEPVLRRQNAPACYTLNGAIYVWTRASLFDPTETVVREESRLFVMPRERSLDIDTGSDFDFARFLLAERDAVP